MAQIIKHRRGSITQLKDVTARVGELIVATGSISDLNGPMVFVGETEGVAGAYRPLSKIYQGATAPTISVGSHGSVIDGTPFYASSNKTLFILNKDGNVGINLTGNIEGNVISGVTINNLTGTTAYIQNISGSFTGSGIGLFDIPASGITGLELNRISEGSATASISQANGLRVNVNTEITGALIVTGDITGSNLRLTGDADIIGNITLGGNITVGDSDTDSVTFGAEISSSIIPDVHNSFDLGSSSKNWRNLHVSGTAYVDTLEARQVNFTDLGVLEDLTVSGSTFLGNGGDITVISGSIFNDQLINNRVVIVGTQGLLEDDANFVFDGTELNVGQGNFTVQQSSGNVDTNGTLNVGGATTLESTLVVTGSTELKNNLGVEGTLDVTGSTVLKSTLEGRGAVGLNSTLDVTGSTVLKDTLQVDSTSQLKGAVGINSTLDVTGSTVLKDTLEGKGAVGFNSTLDVTGSTVLKNTLQVDSTTQLKGAVGINSELDVTGSTVLKSTLEGRGAVGFNSTLDVTGSTVLKDTLEVKGSTSLNSTLDVTGSTVLKSTLQVDSTTQLKSAVGINSTLDVTGSAQFKSTINVDGEATLSSATVEDLTQDRIVTVGAGGSLIDSTGFTYNGSVFKIGDGQFEVDNNDGDIRTSGSLTTNGLTNNGDMLVNGVLTVTGNTLLQSNLFVSGNLEVLGGATSVIIQSQTVELDDNILRLNAYSPFERYAGIEVMDSGSTNTSASFLWDGLNDYWMFISSSGQSSKLVGTTAGTYGSEVSLTTNLITKATGPSTIGDSLLGDDATTLTYNTNKFTVASSDGATLIAGNVTLSSAGGTDGGTNTSAIVFRNSTNVVGYVSTTETTDVLDGILGYKSSDGALVFSTVIDGGTY